MVRKMELQELYSTLQENTHDGVLALDGQMADMTFMLLVVPFNGWQLTIEQVEMALLPDRITIQGVSRINGWNEDAAMRTTILCIKERENFTIQASFFSSYAGTLGGFFKDVYSCMQIDENGYRVQSDIISDFPISNPQLFLNTADYDMEYPFVLNADTHAPDKKGWGIYDFVLRGIHSMSGRVGRDNKFQINVPIVGQISGFFSSLGISLLFYNAVPYDESYEHPMISEAGLEIKIKLGSLPESAFQVPLFQSRDSWNLHLFIREGLSVGDILQFLISITSTDKNAASLCLPSGVALDKFRLYRMNILAQRKERWELTPTYMTIECALSEPWKLPIPYVTLEKLYAGFQISLSHNQGTREDMFPSSLFTAVAGGTLSFELSERYKLSLSLEMVFPELDFSASLALSEKKKEDTPKLRDLAGKFGASLPEKWGGGENLLAELTVSGSGTKREIFITAQVRDLLTFSVGDLPIALSELSAKAQVTTSTLHFSVKGIMTFGEGSDKFMLYAAISYQNPGWIFEGGLLSGRVNILNLLSQMFGLNNIPTDVAQLSLTELAVSYSTLGSEFSLTAAFKAGWEITILGQRLTLGGRIQVLAVSGQKTDVSALAYLDIGDFKILAQIDHIQSADREFLFRIQYQEAYLQAAWFKRKEDEILSVSLGKMTMGSLVESLVHMINPNSRYTLPAPWDILNKINLEKFLMEFNITKKTATFLYRVETDIAGLMYLDKIGVRYESIPKKLYFVLTGRFLTTEYKEEKPLEWDAVDDKPPVQAPEDENKFRLSYLGIGQHVQIDGILAAESIETAMEALKKSIRPSGKKLPVDIKCSADLNWLFGVDFTINDAVNVKVVMNDPVLYGIRVSVQAAEGSALSAFDGFGIELLYKKVTENTGMFKGELLVPKKYRTFQLGILSLTLGTISMEIYTNGGFYIDLGFPHNQDFSRSFQFQWSIYSGRGGIYFGILKDVPKPNVPKVSNGSFSPILLLGLGLSVGLGRSFDFGIVKGGVSLEVFGILEGVLAVFHEQDTQKEDTYYYIKAVAGISGRLFLSADLKIIAIQASVEINASAAITIQAYKKTLIELDLSLKLEAYFKILFIKIEFSFTFHQKVSFSIGDDDKKKPLWEEVQQGAEKSALRSKADVEIETYYESAPLVLESVKLREEKTHIFMEMSPMFVLEEPSLSSGGDSRYAIAFLMIMDADALREWNYLLTDWLLSHFRDKKITKEDAETLSANFADSLTWNILEKFFNDNLSIDYTFRWGVTDSVDSEHNGYVFPMLPPLNMKITQGEDVREIDFWEYEPVDEKYFDSITEYYKELNADPAYRAAAADKTGYADSVKLPVAKAFLTDYVQMYLRELSGRIQELFREYSVKTSIEKACQDFGISGEAFVRQNTELILSAGGRLVFESFHYTVADGDTLESISEKYGVKKEKLWDVVKNVLSLPQTGQSMPFGEKTFSNHQEKEARITLREAAALLFVRFYEEYAPEDIFYAGDIVRMNEEITIEWQEEHPGGRSLILPCRERKWLTFRGDTPQRLGSFLRLLEMKEGEIPAWDEFRKNLYRRNQQNENGEGEAVLEKILFEVPQAAIYQDLTLTETAARIYPDKEASALDADDFMKAAILKINVPVTIPDVVYMVPAQGETTIAAAMRISKATAEDMAAALYLDETLLPEQTVRICGAACMPFQNIREALDKKAPEIGSMLSRFLLQGLKVPVPAKSGFSAKSGLSAEGGEISQQAGALAPLYQALGQQMALQDVKNDIHIEMNAHGTDCQWVSEEPKAVLLKAADIAPLLPNGDFSGLPSGWTQTVEFQETDRTFSTAEGMLYCRQNENMSMHRLSDAVTEILRMGDTEPVITDENGIRQTVEWGCLIPMEIGLCDVDNIFSVYGADAVKRRILYQLYESGICDLHILYQTSKLSRGKQCLMEYGWDSDKSFLVKTNFSVETHMEPVQYLLRRAADEKLENVASIAQTTEFLRMLWECSTVGGGGYYLNLISGDAQSLPTDIFDEAGRGTLYILAVIKSYSQGKDYVNCFATKDAFHIESRMIISTRDEKQRVKKPRFPAGCIGLSAKMPAPLDTDDSASAIMQRLFQIVSYQIKEKAGCYKESNFSAPVIPAKSGNYWMYEPTVPVYRYVPSDKENENNPYPAVGKIGAVLMELRDILGNSLNMGESGILPLYNDEIIGVGEWLRTRVYYRIRLKEESAYFECYIEYCEDGELLKEAVERQRRAYWQVMCEDMEIILTSPVNGAEWRLSEYGRSGENYLEQIRAYAGKLSDYLEQRVKEPPTFCLLELPLRLDEYPLPEDIFQIRAVMRMERSELLAPEKCARSTVNEIMPYSTPDDAYPFKEFCEEAHEACPTLFFAQDGSGNSPLYGVTAGDRGYLQKCSISPKTLTSLSAVGEEKMTVQAPEFYAFRPLYNGFLTRSAKIRNVQNDYSLEKKLAGVEWSCVNLTDIDMEIWAVQYLADFEKLLEPEQVQRALLLCRNDLDKLLSVKKKLAEAIALQMIPLRKGGEKTPEELLIRAQDGLKRSLIKGYETDAAACYHLEMKSFAPCRLTAGIQNRTKECEINAGKADTEKEEFFLFFTNQFKDNARELQASILFTELEYDIEAKSEYESSRWLKFVTPLSADDLGIGRINLESGLYIPNPLKLCPLPPAMDSHSCEVKFNKKVCWDYSLRFHCRYEMQDTIHIRIVFESMYKLMSRNYGRDLFDLLAEYMTGRDKLQEAFWGENDDNYANAFASFLDIGEEMADVWSEWNEMSQSGYENYEAENVTKGSFEVEKVMAYSCTVNAERTESGIRLVLTSTKEGEAFLAQMGLAQPEIDVSNEKWEPGQETDMELRMKHLPLYQCSRATPAIRLVRNQNLLKDKVTQKYWDVREEFIYKTQEVSLPVLTVSGIKLEEEKIGATREQKFGENTIEEAIDILFDAFELKEEKLSAEIGVSYYYLLEPGREDTRVVLPVTFVPMTETASLEKRLKENIKSWYRQNEADTTDCGFLFLLKLYAPNKDRILYFSKLNVACPEEA